MKRFLILILAAVSINSIMSADCAAAAGGRITGTVTDASTGAPIPFANVVLTGTKMGAMTLTDGKYLIPGVPAGTYTVRVMMMGYVTGESKGLKVADGKTVEVDFALMRHVPGGTQEIIVEGEVKQRTAKEEFDKLPAEDVVEAMALKQGVASSCDNLRVSGGRGGGMHFQCMPMRMRETDWNTEEYDHIVENRFLGVLSNPLSTFSIDVDAASYANVRRFVLSGQYPYADAVRVEEMINYFDYDYEKPDGDVPFSINLEYGMCPWSPGHRLVHIGLQGQTLPEGRRKPSNLVFLIDVSGSMRPANKLPLLRDAFKLLVNQLKDDDQVSVVVYAGAAGLVLPATRGNRKEEIKAAIDRLNAGGSTAGGEGIRLAYKVAGENFIEGGNNRVILATDGDFNVGISSTSELVRYIEEKRDDGIFLTVLGFGVGNYKDHRLEQLADRGNGNHAYIDNIMEAKKVLVNDVTATLYTIAKDVKIQVEFNPARVESYRLIGYENRMLETEDFEDDTKDAGEIGAGHTVTALYEIVPAGGGGRNDEPELRYQRRTVRAGAARSDELLNVSIRYKEPDGSKSRLVSRVLKGDAEALEKTSDDFRFSAAVAMFGMILRESEHVGDADLKMVSRMASGARGSDPFQYRAEFIQIVERTKLLAETGGSRAAAGE